MRRTLSSTLIAGVAAAALAGCVISPALPGRDDDDLRPTATASPAPGSMGDCGGGELTITEPGDHRIGDCNELVIEGNGIDVDAGMIGSLVIRGDDIDVDADGIGSIDIEGQDNDVDSRSDVGEVEIAGDRNGIDVEGSIGRVTIAGNENEIEATGGIGAADDNGDRNEILQNQR